MQHEQVLLAHVGVKRVCGGYTAYRYGSISHPYLVVITTVRATHDLEHTQISIEIFSTRSKDQGRDAVG